MFEDAAPESASTSLLVWMVARTRPSVAASYLDCWRLANRSA